MILVHTYNEIPGIHYWKNAPACVDYLRSPHRHNFVIQAKFLVTGEDREIEIFTQQKGIKRLVCTNYRYDGELVYFESDSCEQIAKKICSEYPNCVEVTVLEDGKGGASVRK